MARIFSPEHEVLFDKYQKEVVGIINDNHELQECFLAFPHMCSRAMYIACVKTLRQHVPNDHNDAILIDRFLDTLKADLTSSVTS